MPTEQKTQIDDAELLGSPIYNCDGRHKCVKTVAEDVLPQTEVKTQPRVWKAQQRAIEKAAQNAEKMKPRPCRLPSCRKEFQPKRVQDWKSGFCCKQHQAEFWVVANNVAAVAITGNMVPALLQSEFKPGVSHRQQVLDILKRNVNQWVEHPREMLPGVIWNSRVADLRREGYKIETRTVGERPVELVGGYTRHRDGVFVQRDNWPKYLPGKHVEYQYMLVMPEGR